MRLKQDNKKKSDEDKQREEEEAHKSRANTKDEKPIILPRQQRVANIEKIIDKKRNFEFPKIITD